MNKTSDPFRVLKLVMDQVTDWVLITDIDGTILYANPKAEKLSGYSAEELLGKTPSILKSDLVPRETYDNLWETILKGQVYEGVIANRHKDRSLYYLASNIYPIKDQMGKIQYFTVISKDISDENGLKKQLHKTMHYDGLTGLLNRKSFIEKVSEVKKYSKGLAVIAITINKLGLINSSYGFVCGDKLIKETGQRIKEVVESICSDCVVSRPEGKVFALLLPDYISPSKIVGVIREIEASMQVPMGITNQEIYASLTFGISTLTTSEDQDIEGDPDILLTRAQLALSKAKEAGKSYSYEFYTSSMNQHASDLILQESEIRLAHSQGEFISYFQPFINLETGKISGLEALVRWEKATGEIGSPIEFIGILEETGLIVDVGYDLIEQICSQIRAWTDQFGYSVPVAINLSPVQFKDEKFCEKIIEIVEKQKISPSLITFEITESMLIEDIRRTVNILEGLRTKGFSISIDDFGTGYSSLSYIQKFNINYIKIDMSFVRNIVTSEADQSIVKAIIMMADGLSLKTIAEGVETLEQKNIIKGLGCNIGQGYYWEKPLPANKITKRYFENK